MVTWHAGEEYFDHSILVPAILFNGASLFHNVSGFDTITLGALGGFRKSSQHDFSKLKYFDQNGYADKLPDVTSVQHILCLKCIKLILLI